jgi:hypothetical protein
LDDGTVLVAVVDGPAISLATNDFSARGGDQYKFRSVPFTTVGVTYQQALSGYLTDDLRPCHRRPLPRMRLRAHHHSLT